MGGLCKEGHEFLRVCKKKDLEKAHHMMDVLITQHAKWTARRIKRSLFGQTLIDFSKDSWSRILIDNAMQKTTQRRGINLQPKCIPRLARQFSSFSVVDDSQKSQPIDEVEIGVDSGSESEVSRNGGSGTRPVVSSQPSFQRSPEAFHAADEDFSQDSREFSVPATPQRTEFFDLSPT